MREIKFRAWDTEENEYYSEEGDVNTMFYWGGVAMGRGTLVGLEFEQFTGLHDKNGKDAYKNDRCSVLLAAGKTVKATVVFVDGCFELKFDEHIIINERNTTRDYLKCHTCNHAVEVIGTIHDSES